MAQRLMDRVVKALPLPKSKTHITYDTELKGFGVRITPAGARSFILNYRIKSRERRYTIGSYPDWSVAAAREEVKRLKRQVDLGYDPMGDRHAERAAPTMAMMAERYLEEYAIHKVPRSQSDERSMLRKIILPALGRHTKVQDIRRSDIDDLHRQVSMTRPGRANRIAQLLSAMFNLAIRWEYRIDNPVTGLKRNPEYPRNRYLSGDEMHRLLTVLADHKNQRCANVIRLLLLTGARRGEVMTATWDQFDLKTGVWTKPSAHTKQRREHRVPISAPAMQLLTDIKAKVYPCPYVFPGEIGGPLTEIKTFWKGVCTKAELVNLRIHDLRHTYASILASSGLSLPIIGALLGHTQPSTTARYAHLFDDPLREATERVGSLLSSVESGRTGKIVPMEKWRIYIPENRV